MYRLLGTLTLCLCLASGCETKQNILTQKDVTFFGTGKVSRYQQINDGSLQQLEPLFFAEIDELMAGIISSNLIFSLLFRINP